MSLFSLIGVSHATTGGNKFAGFEFTLSGTRALTADLKAMPADLLRAQRRALVAVKRKVPTEARRDIQREYKLKAGRIKQGLRIRVTPTGIKLIGSARGINAIQLGATWSRRNKIGAKFSAFRGAPNEQHPGTFIATGRSGNRLVFERRGKGRLPLDAVYIASIGQMLKHQGRPDRIANFAQDVLTSELDRLLHITA